MRVYRAVATLVTPLALLVLRYRLARGRESKERWREKLGHASLPRPSGPLVWLHGVGVGEVMALRGLVNEMGLLRDDLSFLVTSTARSAGQTFGRNLPARTIHQYLPFDFPKMARRFLGHWRPNLAVWSDQEIWPALASLAHDRGMPQAMVNARMGTRSFERRNKARKLYAEVYSRLDLITAQDEGTADNIRALMALPDVGVEVMGSLKAGCPPLVGDSDLEERFAGITEGRLVWLAASTHAEDERVVLAAHKTLLETNPAYLLIVVPRDASRGAEVAGACQKLGLKAALRSNGGWPKDEDNSYVADTYGEMGSWYRVAGAAFVGGSMGPVGGHNPWEPARLGCAVLHGPNIVNFKADYRVLADNKAALEVRGPEELASALSGGALDTLRMNATSVVDESAKDTVALAARLAGMVTG